MDADAVARLKATLTSETRADCDDAMARRYLRATAGDVQKVETLVGKTAVID